ncbi:MAG: hypothetical protein PVI21_04140 [Candidatus Woesebacteria bacterium]|jgi:hypothetical protein
MSVRDTIILTLCLAVFCASIYIIFTGKRRFARREEFNLAHDKLLEVANKIPAGRWIGTIRLAQSDNSYLVIERRGITEGNQVILASLIINRLRPNVGVLYRAEVVREPDLNSRMSTPPDIRQIADTSSATLKLDEVHVLTQQICTALTGTNIA